MVTDYNEHVEINNLYDDPDKNEVESIFSTFDIGEYWQYVKKTAVDEADMLRHSELAMLELEGMRKKFTTFRKECNSRHWKRSSRFFESKDDKRRSNWEKIMRLDI